MTSLSKNVLGLIATVALLSMSEEVLSRDIMPGTLDVRWLMEEDIDVSAQRSLVRLSNGTKDQKYLAHYIFWSVEMGALDGIYIINQGVPALRARALNTWWWKVLEGRPAMCWDEPEHEKPIIVLGTKTASNRQNLDVELIRAYEQCGFRELEVEILKNGRPCQPASSEVVLINEEMDIEYGGIPSVNGIKHFSMPPAMYGFKISCEGETTNPSPVFRSVSPGDGIQRETFDF